MNITMLISTCCLRLLITEFKFESFDGEVRSTVFESQTITLQKCPSSKHFLCLSHGTMFSRHTNPFDLRFKIGGQCTFDEDLMCFSLKAMNGRQSKMSVEFVAFCKQSATISGRTPDAIEASSQDISSDMLQDFPSNWRIEVSYI